MMPETPKDESVNAQKMTQNLKQRIFHGQFLKTAESLRRQHNAKIDKERCLGVVADLDERIELKERGWNEKTQGKTQAAKGFALPQH